MACDGGGGWRRRIAGSQVEKLGDEFPAVVQRRRPDEVRLKLHEGFTEQPRLTLEKANERRQVVIPDWWRHRSRVTTPGRDRPADLLHDETLPQADRRRVPGSVLDEVADEGVAPDTSIDVCAELGIERDATFQQERRHGLVLEAGRDRERFGDGGAIVPVLIERDADGVDVAKRRMELERAGKQAFTSKQLQQPPRARSQETLANRWLHDRTGVDQQLCARRAREVLFADRVKAVAIGAGGEFQQAAGAGPVVAVPGQQPRVFSQ